MSLAIQALRSLGAVIAGYASIVIGALIFQDALFGGLSNESPWLHLLIGGGATVAFAGIGGYFLVRIAPRAPYLHAAVLAGWLCIESSLLYFNGSSSLGYAFVAGASLALGVGAGAFFYVNRAMTGAAPVK